MDRAYSAYLSTLLLMLVFGCRQKHETRQAQGIIKTVEGTDSLSPDVRKPVLDSVSTLLATQPNDSLNRALLRKIAYRYNIWGHTDAYGSVSKRLYNQAKRQNDTISMAHGRYYMGDYYDLTARPDSSLYNYMQAEKLYTAAHDTLNAGRAIQCVATILYHNGSYAETEVQAIRALKLFQEAGDNELMYDSYMALALTLSDMKNYTKALDYYKLCLEQIKKMEHDGIYDTQLIQHYTASTYNNMGIIYEYQKEYDTAVFYYNKGFETEGLRQSLPSVYAMLLSNRAYAKTLDHQLDKGVEADLFEAKGIRDSMNLKPGIISSQMHLGEYYFARRDTARGLTYIKEGLAGAKEINSTSDVTKALSLLALGDHKNNTAYSREYFRVTDSLQQAERATRNKFARIAYETDRIEQQNKTLSRRFNIIVAACITLLVFTTGLFIIIRLRAKNRELRYAREQQMANEKIYTLLMQQEAEAENAKVAERNRLAMELHDGIINRIFTTRFNLSQLQTDDEAKKLLLVQELQDTQEEIRKLSHDLKESFLAENESFIAALNDLVAKQQDTAGPVFDLYIDKFINWSLVTPETRVAIFRIIQEASTNAKKHAQAQNCNIALMAQEGTIKLRIWDDGKGFEAKKEKPGIGLKNISDRIKALGGSFTLSSEPGHGTVLEILV